MGLFGEFGEQSYRQNFTQCIDWLKLNTALVYRKFGRTSRKAIVIDPCFISKAGNKTPHIGRFWSGCASAVQHGLEFLGIGCVDIDMRDCMMLRAVQTLGRNELDLRKFTLNDWYLAVLKQYKYQLLGISKYIIADAWFSKKEFTTSLLTIGFELVSRLRDDAVLFYHFTGGRCKGKRGRKRIKDGRIDPKNLLKSRMEEIKVGKNNETAYTSIVYCVSLKRLIRLVVFTPKGTSTPKLFFSTDINMSGNDVFEYYSVRFQIEFNFRDGKQFTGLKDCQARNDNRLDFAFNASLTALNVAKVLRSEENMDLSIGRLKSLMIKAHMLKRFFSVFGLRPNMQLIEKANKEILGLSA